MAAPVLVGDQCLHAVFEAQASRTPDATAIVCGDARWTYAELDRAANSLARRLRALGAAPGVFVATYFERSELPVIAILACLKSGAAYVPIDPVYPGERILHIVTQLGPVLCLTETALAERAERLFGSTRAMVLDASWADVTAWPDAPIPPDESGVGPADLAYVIYTSGTSGRPKGVMAEHRHVTRFMGAFNEVCGTTAEDRVYQGFSLSFDGSVEEIWMAFSNGSTLVVPTRDAPRFGAELGQYLSDRAVTYFSTVPTLLGTIPDDVPSLRTVVLSGEVCPSELVDRWARPGRRLLNAYGPTEATVNTTVAECCPGRPVTIGRPLSGYGTHIVDESLRPVPRGEKGELFISGPTLARGYFHDSALTGERFLEGAGFQGAQRVYRTGDLVRCTADGELEFCGRLDTQVKIRGFRVELCEIETVLREHSRVRAAAVRLVEREGLQQLAACVVVDGPPERLDRGEVLSLLEGRLPPYMVPGFLDVVEELPRTTTGKVDRNQLPPPKDPLVRTARQYVAPRTDLEREIVGVWQEVLGVEPISVTDDFFVDLGGYSLVAARMAAALRQRVSRTVTVRDAYEFPTVRRLAERLEQVTPEETGGPAASAAGRPTGSRAVFHATPRRERLTTFALQFLSIYVLAAMGTIPLGLLVLLARSWYVGTMSTGRAVALGLVVLFATWPIFLTFAIVAKWVVIGRYRAGEYPLWGLYYWRWWLCNRIQAFSGLAGLNGTPLQPLVFRLMGAKVGARCTLDTGQCAAWDLVSIGDDTSIGADTQLLGYRVEDGVLRLGTVQIGDGCFVGIHSALGLDVRMDDGSRLDDQSLLPDGEVIPAGEGRRGSPPLPAEVHVPAAAPRGSSVRRFGFGVAHLVAAELTGLLLAIPGLVLLGVLWLAYLAGGLGWVVLAVVVSVPVGVVVECLTLAGVRRIVLNRVRPGTYSVESLTYLRKWASDGLMALSRAALLPVYTTLYLPPLAAAHGREDRPPGRAVDGVVLRPGAHRHRRRELPRRRLDRRGAPDQRRDVPDLGQPGGHPQLRGQQRGAARGQQPRGRLPPRRAVGATARTGPHPRRLRVARLALVRPDAPPQERELRRRRDLPPDAQVVPPARGDRRAADRHPGLHRPGWTRRDGCGRAPVPDPLGALGHAGHRPGRGRGHRARHPRGRRRAEAGRHGHVHTGDQAVVVDVRVAQRDGQRGLRVGRGTRAEPVPGDTLRRAPAAAHGVPHRPPHLHRDHAVLGVGPGGGRRLRRAQPRGRRPEPPLRGQGLQELGPEDRTRGVRGEHGGRALRLRDAARCRRGAALPAHEGGDPRQRNPVARHPDRAGSRTPDVTPSGG